MLGASLSRQDEMSARRPLLRSGAARDAPNGFGLRLRPRSATVSRADTAGVESPGFGCAFGACPLGPDVNVLFNAKTARVAQSNSPATDLK